ncbi:MAG: DUF1778 domain-containing protein [Alphaproteobacteria bacterium]|nr:DUF1778 domain-containing protein [Alphaproteobacteria bacterium]
MPKSTTLRSESLTIRIKPAERSLLDRAAKIANKTRTDFVLDAARKAAEETLLERTYFTMAPDAFREFVRLLDEPPKPNPNLVKSLTARAPWD